MYCLEIIVHQQSYHEEWNKLLRYVNCDILLPNEDMIVGICLIGGMFSLMLNQNGNSIRTDIPVYSYDFINVGLSCVMCAVIRTKPAESSTDVIHSKIDKMPRCAVII